VLCGHAAPMFYGIMRPALRGNPGGQKNRGGNADLDRPDAPTEFYRSNGTGYEHALGEEGRKTHEQQLSVAMVSSFGRLTAVIHE